MVPKKGHRVDLWHTWASVFHVTYKQNSIGSVLGFLEFPTSMGSQELLSPQEIPFG